MSDETPPAAERLTVEAEYPLRYEDITQDGRLTTVAMPQGLAPLWYATDDWLPLISLRAEGVLPILSHLSMEGGDEPITLARPLAVRGTVELAHARDDDGQVARLLLDMNAELRGVRGLRGDAERVAESADSVLAGRVWARHVFTRPFAPRAQRRVLRFEHAEMPTELPASQRTWRGAEALLELPEDARPIDDELTRDPGVTVFGLHHSDSNQHVNSLVYLRLFEDAVLRRLAAHGRPTTVLSRVAHIGYRKPFFVGQRCRATLRCFELPAQPQVVGALGWLFSEDDEQARPHCTLRLLLRG